MGSSDYLNSARRAAIVFFLLASGALGGAGYELAVSAWGAAPAAQGADSRHDREPHGRVGAIREARPAPRAAGSVEIG